MRENREVSCVVVFVALWLFAFGVILNGVLRQSR